MGMSREKFCRFKKVVNRIEKRGCDLCHTDLGGGVPHHFGRFRRKLVGVCGACVDKLDRPPIGFGMFNMPAPWSEDDRIWFEENLDRNYRLRPPVGEELVAMEIQSGNSFPPVPPGHNPAIAVWQQEVGVRVRVVVYLTRSPGSYSDDEIRLLVPWQSPGFQAAHARQWEEIVRWRG